MNWRQLLERLFAVQWTLSNRSELKWVLELLRLLPQHEENLYTEGSCMQPELSRAAMSSMELRCQRAIKEKWKMRYPKPLYFNTKEKLKACSSETSALRIKDGNGENYSVRAETFKREQEWTILLQHILTSLHISHVLTIRICTQVLISVQIL